MAGPSGLCLLLLAPIAAGGVPANDGCDTATVIAALPATIVTSATGALLDPGELDSECVTPTSGSVWYAVQVPLVAGELVVSTAGSGYDTVVDVYDGTCGDLTWLDCNDDGGPGLSSLVFVPVQGGETLLVRVASYHTTEPGALVLTVVLDGPSNDQCMAATDVAALPYLGEQSTVGATSDDVPGGSCGAATGTVWYRFTPDQDGFLVADTAGSDFDTFLTAYVGECADPDPVACNDDSATLQADLGVPVTAGVPVLFQAGGFEGDLGRLRLHLAYATPPPNDGCESPASLATLPATAEQYVPGATRDPAPESLCGSGSASVWHEIVPPVGGVLTVDTEGSDYDTVLDAFVGSCDAATVLACNDDDGGAVSSRIRFGVAAGEPVRIATSAYEDGAGRNLQLHANLEPCVSDDECARGDGCVDHACVEGACVFTDVPDCCRNHGECDDANPCTIDMCDVNRTCTATPIAGCCLSDAACDDGDPCTTDACTEHACTSTVLDGLDLAVCRLHDDAAACGADAMPDRLRRALDRHLQRAATGRARAAESTQARRTKRLLRRANARIRKAERKLARAVEKERVSAACARALGDALAAASDGG